MGPVSVRSLLTATSRYPGLLPDRPTSIELDSLLQSQVEPTWIARPTCGSMYLELAKKLPLTFEF
jgi:hypothetical protein